MIEEVEVIKDVLNSLSGNINHIIVPRSRNSIVLLVTLYYSPHTAPTYLDKLLKAIEELGAVSVSLNVHGKRRSLTNGDTRPTELYQ